MARFPPAEAPDTESRVGSPPYLGVLSTIQPSAQALTHLAE
jgi:hypothetical protein